MGRNGTGAIGDRAEQHALALLTERGLELVARNFRCRVGEIDLVMLHDGSLVFIEVRYRRSDSFSAPALTIDYRKQRKIIRTAALFLSRFRRFANYTIRFDVVAIVGDLERRGSGNAGTARWVKDAFRPQDSTF